MTPPRLEVHLEAGSVTATSRSGLSREVIGFEARTFRRFETLVVVDAVPIAIHSAQEEPHMLRIAITAFLITLGPFSGGVVYNTPTASADVDPHVTFAIDEYGPGLCAALDQNPDAMTVHDFIQSMTGFTFSDGWQFFEQGAKNVALGSLITYCPQYQALYFGTPEVQSQLGRSFLNGFLGGLAG